MSTQSSTAQRPDDGAALILGGVLGLLLTSVAAVAVGGWQYWKSQVTVVPAVIAPANNAAPVGYPTTGQPYGSASGYSNSAPYIVPAGAASNPQPATPQLVPQSTEPNANSNNWSVAPAPASTVAPTLLSPDASNSVELKTENVPTNSAGE